MDAPTRSAAEMQARVVSAMRWFVAIVVVFFIVWLLFSVILVASGWEMGPGD